jgi:hypothetical protein
MTGMMRALLILAAATIAGCSLNRARLSECQGTVTATVRNDWNYPVDVYADTRGSGYILGEVRPGGREEFALPADATGVYFRWRSVSSAAQPTSSDLPTSYACR